MIFKLPKDFWYYEIGQFISYMGDFCSTIALSWWVLEKTGSITQLTFILAPSSIFKIILLPIFAPLSDHFSRKNILLIADFMRFIACFCIAICVYYDYYQIVLLLILYSILNIFSALYITTSSIVTQLIPENDLEKGMRISQSMTSLGGISGGAFGGFVVAYLGIFVAFAFDAFSFLIAAFFTLLIKTNTIPRGVNTSNHFSFLKWKTDFKIGIKLIFTSKILLGMSLIALSINFFVASIWILFPLYIKNIMLKNADYFGWMETFYAVGTLGASLLLGRIMKNLKGFYAYFTSFLFVGIFLALIPISGNFFPLILMFLIGFLITIANIPYLTKMSIAVPDRFRSRISSITSFMAAGITPLGIAAAGFFAIFVDVTTLIFIYGLCISITIFFMLLIPNIMVFMNASQEECKALLKNHFKTID